MSTSFSLAKPGSETPQQESQGQATYIDLDNLVYAGASGGQDSLDVVAANLCLSTDVSFDQVGGGVGGNLSRDEDLAVGADGLGL